MRIEFLCISIIKLASGPRVKLVDCKNVLTSPPHLATVLLTVLRQCSRCCSYSVKVCCLFYEAIHINSLYTE